MGSPAEGRVVAIHLNVGHREPMQPVTSASFVEGVGVEGDRHATEKADRRGFQVLLAETETLEALNLEPGVIKENVTTSGIDLSFLKPGQILELGDQVVLEVYKVCLPCSRMEELRPGLQQELEGRRGQLAAIVRGGAVEVGDQVRIREQAAVS